LVYRNKTNKNKVDDIMLNFVLAGLIGLGTIFGGAINSNQPTQQIIEENGYMVLAGDNNPDTSTIVATVQDNDMDRNGYVIAVNNFDKADTVDIIGMGLHKGDEVLITFYNDDVVKVQKNNLKFPR
jgi:co-chaperonin GroES (HSP10)